MAIIERIELKDLFAGAGDFVRNLIPHADAKLRERIQRMCLMPAGDRRDEECRRCIMALLRAEDNSPENMAKRKAERSRIARGEFQVTPGMAKLGDLMAMDRVLGLKRQEDPETGDELCPSREELIAARWEALAKPRARRKHIEAAFTAYMIYLRFRQP